MSDPTTRSPDSPSGRSISTRRRTLLALAGIALGAAGHGYAIDRGAEPATAGDDASMSHIEAATAIAQAVYPSAVAVSEGFIERRVFGRVEPRPGHFEELVTAIEAVDAHARARFGDPVSALPPAGRRRVLRSMGVTAVHPIPDGTTPERVRFFLVNDLLFALFTSPASTVVTGIENPPGHPGGRDAYRHGPDGRTTANVWNRNPEGSPSTDGGSTSDG